MIFCQEFHLDVRFLFKKLETFSDEIIPLGNGILIVFWICWIPCPFPSFSHVSWKCFFFNELIFMVGLAGWSLLSAQIAYSCSSFSLIWRSVSNGSFLWTRNLESFEMSDRYVNKYMYLYFCISFVVVIIVEAEMSLFAFSSWPWEIYAECNIGTFSDVEGLNTSSQCKPCPPGYHCNSTGLSLPAARCFAGYFCTGGSVRFVVRIMQGRVMGWLMSVFNCM